MTGTYHSRQAQRQFTQNIAAISAEFHTHRLYNAFYETFGIELDEQHHRTAGSRLRHREAA